MTHSTDTVSDERLARLLEGARLDVQMQTSSRYKREATEMVSILTELSTLRAKAKPSEADAYVDWTSQCVYMAENIKNPTGLQPVWFASPPQQGVTVKALEWRVPTDHPSDPDRDENVYCADGIGGRYAISKKQKVGPERLLWMTDDPFVWVGYNSIPEAEAAAQADYERRILAALTPSQGE